MDDKAEEIVPGRSYWIDWLSEARSVVALTTIYNGKFVGKLPTGTCWTFQVKDVIGPVIDTPPPSTTCRTWLRFFREIVGLTATTTKTAIDPSAIVCQPASHAYCGLCEAIRPVRWMPLGPSVCGEYLGTDIKCNECHLVIATIFALNPHTHKGLT